MVLSSFSPEQVTALTRGPGFPAGPGERECPACGARRIRAYLHAPPAARRPTLVSYVWCAACARFVGTRAKHPEGVVFADPIAALPDAERRELERSLIGFFAHLDRLWDDGVLPQSLTTP